MPEKTHRKEKTQYIEDVVCKLINSYIAQTTTQYSSAHSTFITLFFRMNNV